MLKDRVLKRMIRNERRDIRKYIKEREWALLENGSNIADIAEFMIYPVSSYFEKEGFIVEIFLFEDSKKIKITLPEECFKKEDNNE